MLRKKHEKLQISREQVLAREKKEKATEKNISTIL